MGNVTESVPFISVVIPTHRRRDLLTRCLESLRPDRQGVCISDYEIIVTDDCREESAEETVSAVFPGARWVFSQKSGPGQNRNNGARNATGEWVLFIDDDCIAKPNMLREIAALARAEQLDVIEGKILCPDQRDSPFYIQPDNYGGGFFWTANLAIRRTVFLDLGGFDEGLGLGEDMELGERIKRQGIRWKFLASAVVEHPAQRIDFQKWIKRNLNMRWVMAYRQRIGEAAPHGAYLPAICLNVVSYRTRALLRNTRNTLRDGLSWGWRTRLFNSATEWILFPMMTAYLVYWDLRFRGMSHKRQS